MDQAIRFLVGFISFLTCSQYRKRICCDFDLFYKLVGFKHAHTGELIARIPGESEQDLVERAYSILGAGYHPLYVITKAPVSKPNMRVPGASEVSSDSYRTQIGEATAVRQKDLATIAKSIEP